MARASKARKTSAPALPPERQKGVHVGYLSAAMQQHHTFAHLKETVDSVKQMPGVDSDEQLEQMYEEARGRAKARGVEVPPLDQLPDLAQSEADRPLPAVERSPTKKA